MENLIVFKGRSSQTGIAFDQEFGKCIDYENSKLSFPEIKEILKGSAIVTLPIWNSHEGEISISYALSMIFENDVKLFHLWPKDIFFECIKKQDSNGSSVVSVPVAKTQCSDFIKMSGFEFVEAGSTVDAYKVFRSDDACIAALIPPGMNKNNYETLEKNAQNSLNFTTFSILSCDIEGSESCKKWGAMHEKILPPKNYFSGIQMPLNENFSETQNEIFDQFIQNSASVEAIPKAIFVAEHNESECRIIFESNSEFSLHDVLNEDGADNTIITIPEAGFTANSYAERVTSFLESKESFPGHDFIKHLGTQTCFYACPALGIVTHGFSSETTELIVKKMINKCFEMLVKLDLPDNPTKIESLFIKYRDEYLAQGTEFIEFQCI